MTSTRGRLLVVPCSPAPVHARVSFPARCIQRDGGYGGAGAGPNHGRPGHQRKETVDHHRPFPARGASKGFPLRPGSHPGLPVLSHGGGGSVPQNHPLDLEGLHRRKGPGSRQGRRFDQQLLHLGQQHAGQGLPELPSRMGQPDRSRQLPQLPRSEDHQLGGVLRGPGRLCRIQRPG